MNLSSKVTTLSNGLRIVTATNTALQSVALGIWVGVGGRHESSSMTGISHFIEHMLFKGTTKRSARAITRAIEGRGGYCNAFTQEENTCYYARVTAQHVWQVLDIMTDMYLRPKFDTTDIAREKDVILEEVQMLNDQPEQLVQEILNGMLWQQHQLGQPLTGTAKTLRFMDREHLLNFKEQKYVPANTIFVFAGPMPHEECVKKVHARLKQLPASAEPSYRHVTDATKQERLKVCQKNIEQTHIALGFRIFGRLDRRKHALRLLNIILGENMSSRLFQSIREKYALAYSVYSSIQLFAETGVLAISAGADDDRAEQALKLIIRELKLLCKKPVLPREITEACEYATGQLLLTLEGPSGQMHWLGDSVLNYGSVLNPETVIKEWRSVTPTDIYDLANDIFNFNRASLAVLSTPETSLTYDNAYAMLHGLRPNPKLAPKKNEVS